MLHLMGLSAVETCTLCGANKCTLFHILVGCDKALKDKRYTWRHDSVLATLLQLLVPVLMRHNASKPASSKPTPITFVKGGNTNLVKPTAHKSVKKNLLEPANDWQLLIDFDCCRMTFPPIIVSTSERPDIVVWSSSTKTVILVELTCPAEENFAKANTYKTRRYAPLMEQIDQAGWTGHCRTIEAGARGLISHRFHKTLRELSLSSKEASQACKDISLISAKCSYGIWLARKSLTWNASLELIVPTGYLTPAPTTTPAPLLSSQSTRANSDWHERPELSSGALPASESRLAATAAFKAASAASAALSAAAEAASSAKSAEEAAQFVQFISTLRPASKPRASLALSPGSQPQPRRRRRRRTCITPPAHLLIFSVPEDSVPTIPPIEGPIL